MTPEEFRAARRKLGLSVTELGAILDVTPRTVRRWEDGTREPHPTACVVVGWLLAGFNPATMKPLETPPEP